MKPITSAKISVSVLALATVLFVRCGREKSNGNAHSVSVEEATSIATQAYIYGYPLVTIDMTRKEMTNIASQDAGHAPMDQLVRMRAYPAGTDLLYRNAR